MESVLVPSVGLSTGLQSQLFWAFITLLDVNYTMQRMAIHQLKLVIKLFSYKVVVYRKSNRWMYIKSAFTAHEMYTLLAPATASIVGYCSW